MERRPQATHVNASWLRPPPFGRAARPPCVSTHAHPPRVLVPTCFQSRTPPRFASTVSTRRGKSFNGDLPIVSLRCCRPSTFGDPRALLADGAAVPCLCVFQLL